MPKISISYRRADSEAMTGRIFDRLVAHYGKDAIFRDIENIPAGIDFRQHINEVLLKTNVLIAIVGPKWLGSSRGGHERINEESDPVRVEVETALRRRLRIIPVLIGQTRMPSSDQLPPSLKDFAFLNAVRVDTGRDFDHHMEDHLIRSIDEILAQAAKSPPSRETSIAASADKSAAKADKPQPVKLDAPRKRETGARPAAAAGATATPQASKWQASAVAPSAHDWRYALWPKSRSGRRLRLAALGAAAVILLTALTLDLWPAGSGAATLRHLFSLQNPAPVSALALSPDAQMIAAASLDRSVNIWRVGGKSLLATLSAPDGVSSVAFTPDDREVVFGAVNGAIDIAYADASGQIVRSLKPEVAYAWQAIPAIWSIAVSPDATRVVSGSDDGTVAIWSMDGELLHSAKRHDDVVTALAFFPDGKAVVSASKDGTVRMWNVESGSDVATLRDHSGQVLSVAVSGDGKLIAGAGSGNRVVIWNAASGRVVHVLASNLDTVNAIAFSADAQRLFVGGDGASLEIWTVASAQRLQTVNGNSHSVRAFALSQDGSRLASGGDQTIDLWSSR